MASTWKEFTRLVLFAFSMVCAVLVGRKLSDILHSDNLDWVELSRVTIVLMTWVSMLYATFYTKNTMLLKVSIENVSLTKKSRMFVSNNNMMHLFHR